MRRSLKLTLRTTAAPSGTAAPPGEPPTELEAMVKYEFGREEGCAVIGRFDGEGSGDGSRTLSPPSDVLRAVR